MAQFLHYEACPRCRANGRDTSGDNLARYADNSGYCFSCKYRESGSTPLILDTLPRGSTGTTKLGILPDDFDKNIPNNALSWLLQYELPYSYWSRSIGWSNHYQRLIFKVGEPLQFSIGRYFGDNEYRKWFVWGNSHKHCEVINSGNNNSKIVVVEDLVSAHKVGQLTDCIPLFGTKLHPCHLYYLTQEQKPVIMWLDKDQANYTAKEAVRLQNIIGQPVEVVHTDVDPKSLSYSRIKEIINA